MSPKDVVSWVSLIKIYGPWCLIAPIAYGYWRGWSHLGKLTTNQEAARSGRTDLENQLAHTNGAIQEMMFKSDLTSQAMIDVLSRLRDAELMTSAEMSSWAQRFVVSVRNAEAFERRVQNPLTPAELDRFSTYRQMIERGDLLNVEQARDFEALAQKMKKDHPNNSDIIATVAVAGFLLMLAIALFSGGKKG